MKIKKNIQSKYQIKCCKEKHVDLFLIVKGKKSIMFLSKISINSCMIMYYLQAFRTVEKLKCHIKHCFKINDKQTIKMPENDEYVTFKNLKEK